jgi:glycosyltransferase involved in cell wall biosynthesis
MSDRPLVSILINNYNYGRFLGEAIDGALAQTYENVEVVVVDDGSKDNSREVIASYGGRIRGVLKENGGQASAFNAGIAASKGEIICLLDSDDIFLPDKVASIVRILDANPQVGWCFDQVRKFDDGTKKRLPDAKTDECGLWDAREVTAAGKPPYISTATSGLSFRRRVVERIFPMPELLRLTSGCSSDAYIKWTALALDSGWMACDELTLMRVHSSNAYTGQPAGKKRLRGEIELSTAICLYEQWPILHRLALKVFSRGLGMLWANGGVEGGQKKRVDTFLRNLAFPEKFEVFLRACVWTTVRRFGN